MTDQLPAGHDHRPQDIAGENGLLTQLTKALLERAMQAELTDHLGYRRHHRSTGSTTSRYGNPSANRSAGRTRYRISGAIENLYEFARAGLTRLLWLSSDWLRKARSVNPCGEFCGSPRWLNIQFR